MTQEELLQAYLDKGYEKEYFKFFNDYYTMEYGDTEDEYASFQTTCKFMDVFMAQISLGHSCGWANRYAGNKIYNPFFDITDDSMVSEILEETDDEDKRKDLEIFVKEFDEDDIFNYAYVEAWKCDTLAAPRNMENYSYAKEYSRIFHELLKEGHSTDYAKGWLYVPFEYEDIDKDLYARAYEAALQHNFDLCEALRFADKVCFRFIETWEIPDKRIEYMKKYSEDWQIAFFKENNPK